MTLTDFVIFSLFLTAVCGIKATIRSCNDISDDRCTVTEARIDPCNFKNGICTLSKEINVTISFDFIPKFATSNLKSLVYYEGSAFSDMGNVDTCALTTCPTVPDTPQTYTHTLYIGKKLPKGKFPIEWKVWSADNDKTDVCCFGTTIKLPKTAKKK